MKSKINSISILNKRSKPKPSVVYNTYWRFASERQNIFFKRLENSFQPWTHDVILNLFKFTNVYRATDRVSQYLINEVIYKGDQEAREVLFRILFFKIFNKIETWELMRNNLGEITFKEFDFTNYNSVLEKAKQKGQSIYSGAYIMASGKEAFGCTLKHQNHLKLIQCILTDQFDHKILAFKKMEDLYLSLKGYPTIGSFLAYQFAIDINYSRLTNFSEMEFVKAGPGAKDGIKKCFSDFGDYSEEDIIRMMADNQQSEFDRLEIEFKDLWGRPLQLIDCQNIFCEVDKYSRIAHPEISGLSKRKRIKQKFIKSRGPISLFFPPKWAINEKLFNYDTRK